MMDQFFDNFRKASESSLQIQQEFLKQWTQPWLSGGPFGGAGGAGAAGDAGRNVQRRWVELGVDLLNKHRQSVDATYAAGIQLIEQTFRVSDAKSPDDYRHVMEDLLAQAVRHLQEPERGAVQRLPALVAEVGRSRPRCSRLARPVTSRSGSTPGAPPTQSGGTAWRRCGGSSRRNACETAS